MYPYVLESWIGDSVLIPTYGLMLALAFTAGYIDSLRRALARGQDPKQIERLFLVVVLGSLAGARLFHVVFEELAHYRKNPADALAIWEGGFTFYGGLLVCLGLIYGYCRRKKMDFGATVDLIAAPTMLGLAIGRIGCFAAGCCWGKSTAVSWGVTYTHHQTMSGMRYVPVHPVQIYESLGALAIYITLSSLARKPRPSGQIALAGLASYAVLRFVVEFFRGDEYRGFILGGWLSLSQFLSLGLLFFCLVAWSLERSPQRAV